ncbi:phosphopantetheine-binding protein [Ruminiclostridium papyrosolvens DSM 2782]|uniref:Phosphopantetheine-binding protein n=1 Tax=Ruminiclostridium papyrosolvens DSM 2782 TaxID=588581 RepID=F1T7C1_9FIRM|nr:acyl carrier protein [Ruminiclostridium papyrosolvens]EGD49369.1 phosphopantetheine-binding protein [Ruminiclostridium papyrosolvens DSM 2782]WES33504.1 acyl carrier protein [Ruminiclostridium papyrosolvens DSM 2782]
MTETKESIQKCVRKCLNEDENYKVDLDAELTNLGMNSITLIKLLVLLEAELGIQFDESKFSFKDYKTLNSVAEYVDTLKV